MKGQRARGRIMNTEARGLEIEKAEGQSVHLQKVINETETNIRELLAANPGLQEELLKNGYVQ